MAAAATAVGPESPALVGGPACPAEARFQFWSIDDYEMLEEIGEGTFGFVAKARDRRTGETVAVKWIHGGDGDGEDGAAHLRAAVLREAGCLDACRGHPSVVELRGVAADEATGDLSLVMEFVGPSLQRRLTRPFSEAEARACMRQLLGATELMHGAGTIHRDIKPDNILVGAGGALKLCDFGCASPARPLGKAYPERRTGTTQYNAPEQLMGIRSYGPAVDMWALGCVMAELLIGRPLLVGCTAEDILVQLPMGPEAFDGMLSLAGREVLAGLLSYNPCERLTAVDALKHRWFAEEDAAEPPAAEKAEYPGFAPLSRAAQE
ncbi:putative cyclin-dependent kinase F-2 [Panicum miliaceum]|uniref:[RNA-polymerase]-subunit kinase n=1 Tax=Panicum miliaceum TaxID=4540 RepID=A0A3L6RSB9_PANMI|nr:putative cyclin-dependent kinase F-2 [Panicum miliaceum]